MARYARKIEIVDAVQYKRGMEDGFDCYSITGQFIGTYLKNSPLPKSNRKPFIFSFGGKDYLEDGDYIVTTSVGNKFACTSEVFNKTYQKID